MNMAEKCRHTLIGGWRRAAGQWGDLRFPSEIKAARGEAEGQ